MSDPAIKLFGKTIPLPELGDDSSSSYTRVLTKHQDQNLVRLSDSYTGDGGRESESQKEEKDNESREDQGEEDSLSHDSSNIATSTPKDAKTSEESSRNGTCSEETKLKKPDKILPCPRCNSMETKFCYYNNYNVNQPRHFCKKCQRYWTAGGTMRNVPIGAGRRKNKNPVSCYNHHLSITSAERTDLQQPNGTNLLTFGSDCESMASGMNLADKTMLKTQTGLEEHNESLKITHPINPRNDECGTISPLPKVPYFTGPPTWQYAWNGVSWTVLPFYPQPGYRSCPGVTPGAWNGFWMQPQPNSSSRSNPNSLSRSNPNSPRLGKHSRDESIIESGTCIEETDSIGREKSKPERSLWVPKTLRVVDLEEAAKSSIWETLGIKKDEKSDTFGAFRSSNKEKISLSQGKLPGRRPDLQANPAALSRSANFHESS